MGAPTQYSQLPRLSLDPASNEFIIHENVSKRRSFSICLSTIIVLFRLLAIGLLITEVTLLLVFTRSHLVVVSVVFAFFALGQNILVIVLAIRPISGLPFRIIVARRKDYASRITTEAARLAVEADARSPPLNRRHSYVPMLLDAFGVVFLLVSAVLAVVGGTLLSISLFFIWALQAFMTLLGLFNKDTVLKLVIFKPALDVEEEPLSYRDVEQDVVSGPAQSGPSQAVV